MTDLKSRNSFVTILPSDKDDNNSDWSMVWSTTHVAGMDTATGAGRVQARRVTGRRRLRMTALSLGGLLCMHCRLVSCVLTTGIYTFLLLIIMTVLLLGNPVRHYEVYVGQWSISGPGRAFRIIPSLDGVGIAICIHALFRALTNVGIAAVAGVYMISTINDQKLPLYSCRDFDLNPYNPLVMLATLNMKAHNLEEMSEAEFKANTMSWEDASFNSTTNVTHTVNLLNSYLVCNESYPAGYPPLYKTTAYNYFYVEAMHYRKDNAMSRINVKHLVIMLSLYAFIWILMIIERIRNGRIIWNNMYMFVYFIPWVWACLVIFMGCYSYFTTNKELRKHHHKMGGSKEVAASFVDVFELALYIHASALGSEIIHGKGLNHYASGHIDPKLNDDALWHSALLLILSAAIAGGAASCALTDYIQLKSLTRTHESVLWVFPMFAKCAAGVPQYTHFVSTLIFSGLCFAYLTSAFIYVKSALHAIFEYKVKLIFIEQLVVFVVLLFCAGISILFSTHIPRSQIPTCVAVSMALRTSRVHLVPVHPLYPMRVDSTTLTDYRHDIRRLPKGGVALLEAFDSILAGLVAPFISTIELITMMYVYRSPDFISDLNVSTEENVCSTRIGIQWHIAPFITLGVFIGKFALMIKTEIPSRFMWGACVILFMVLVAIPLRTVYNAYTLLHPPNKA